MKYHSTHFDDYLWFLVLREIKRKKKKKLKHTQIQNFLPIFNGEKKRASDLFQKKNYIKAYFSDKKYDSMSPKNSNLHAKTLKTGILKKE